MSNHFKCDHVIIDPCDGASLLLGDRPFSISVRLTDGTTYRYETLTNNGVKGDTPDQLAEYFEELAAMMRQVANCKQD